MLRNGFLCIVMHSEEISAEWEIFKFDNFITYNLIVETVIIIMYSEEISVDWENIKFENYYGFLDFGDFSKSRYCGRDKEWTNFDELFKNVEVRGSSRKV